MLKKIRNVLWLIFFMAACFLGAWVVVDNNYLVDFNLFGLLISQRTVGFLVLASFAAGLLLGLFGNILVTSWMAIKLNRFEKRLQKQEVKSASTGKPV